MQEIRIFLNVPDSFRSQVDYTIAFFGIQLGANIRLITGEEKEADIAYGPVERKYPIHISFVPEMYTVPHLQCFAKCVDKDIKLWMPKDQSIQDADLFGSIYRLLNRVDEELIGETERNTLGIFKTEALNPERRNEVIENLVDQCIHYLKNTLVANGGIQPDRLLNYWPENKKAALLLTHDTDAVRASKRMEIATNLTKGLFRSSNAHWQLAKMGLKHRGDIKNDPVFGFENWKKFEENYQIRACHYLFVPSRKVKRHINDCKSDVRDRAMDWNLLRAMAEDGWEFGLHPSIHAHKSLEGFYDCKQWIEDKLGRPIFGIRHHYWALDWKSPYKTWRKHINSGFRYDSSMAWRDSAGFRTGTSLPYRPYDPQRQRALDIYELPVAIMDSHLIQNGTIPEALFKVGNTIKERVKKVGGILNLDWHTETNSRHPAYRAHPSLLVKLIQDWLDDPNVWLTTPWKLVQHWHIRSKKLKVIRE